MNSLQWFTNARIFRENGVFQTGAFSVAEERFIEFAESAPAAADTITDLNGAWVIPGLVDIHIHGCNGADFSDGEEDSLPLMASFLASKGITTFLATSMSLPPETLQTAFRHAKEYAKGSGTGARLAGIHMEGPFLSPERKGSQNEAYLIKPNVNLLWKLQQDSGSLIRIVDAAPELESASEFVHSVSSFCCVSAAHTAACYEDACEYFDAGASHITHLFNAMPGFHHRNPGPIAAAAEREYVTAELICDGYHVHPAAVRIAFRLFPGRICLISDALRCCGMPEGEYLLGGQRIILKDGVARLTDGTLAGASSDLYQDLQNAVSFGIPMEEAIMAASKNPAEAAGLSEIGRIEPGAMADFIVTDEKLERQAVYIGGKQYQTGT